MKTRIMYLRDKTHIVSTVLMEVDFATKKVNYSVATLHPKDECDKHLARKIVAGRFKSKCEENYHTTTVEGDMTAHRITAAVMRDILSTKTYSNRTRRVAKAWLEQHNVK